MGWTDWIDEAIELVGIGAGSAAEYAGQSSANASNIQIMREQQAWQERMSNTAHQREVKDLRDAGLNPVLSAKYQGASTGNVASAKSENKLAGQRGQAVAISKMLAEIKLMKDKSATEKTQQSLNKQTKELAGANTILTVNRANSAEATAKIDKINADIASSPWVKGSDKARRIIAPFNDVLRGKSNLYQNRVKIEK